MYLVGETLRWLKYLRYAPKIEICTVCSRHAHSLVLPKKYAHTKLSIIGHSTNNYNAKLAHDQIVYGTSWMANYQIKDDAMPAECRLMLYRSISVSSTQCNRRRCTWMHMDAHGCTWQGLLCHATGPSLKVNASYISVPSRDV